MASDGPGKFKEKKNRASKPYDRPKGIIRRVTDSVTGLFSSSWLSGWMAAEEEEEANEHQQAGTSQISSQSRVAPQVNTLAPPGESFIFAQPVAARRSFRPIYPEEGEIEGNSNQAHGVNVGASTSAGVRMNMPAAASVAIPTATAAHLSTDTPSPVLTGRRHPIISSTPTQMYTARTKSQLEPRPLSLLTSSTPTGDDASEFSESSADTGVDASVIPRPDERDYQREILQLDDESLQTLRESLAKSAPVPPTTQPPSALPSLEETRKRPRDAEPDQTSIRAEGSLSNRSLFSETGDVSLSQPQPSALASKRPRFNVSTYGSSFMGDRSVLSDSSFKMSPFYPGKTMFGGASSYRKGKLQSRAQTARVQVKPKPAQASDDGGLSQAARRILECLEQMSTPISDAKRIPTPIPGQRGSFLDAASSYTAVYHRHLPTVRQAGPPTSKSSAPVKVSPQENLSASLLVNTSSGSSSACTIRSTGVTTSVPPTPNSNSRFEMGVSGVGDGSASCDAVPREEREDSNSGKTPREDFSVSFAKAAAEATAKFKPSVPVTASATTTSSSVFSFGLPSNSSSSQSFEFIPKPAAPLSSDLKKHGGGKVKSKVVNSGRTCNKLEEEDVDGPRLPSVSLSMSSLPKIDLPTPARASSSPEGFKFSSPEVVHSSNVPSESATSPPVFKFSSPAAVVRGNVNNLDSATVSSGPLLFNSCSTGSAPKLKEVMKKDKSSSVGELKEGSVLDILKPKRKSPEKTPKENLDSTPLFNSIDGKSSNIGTSFSKVNENTPKFSLEQTVSTINSVPKKPETSQAFQGFSSFMKKSDEWECSECMLRNKNTVEKCVACQSAKPGLDSNSKTGSLITNAVEDRPPPAVNSEVGWGDAFKKSANEWECETCMLRNKNTSVKCAACETPKPGSKSEPMMPQDSKVSESKDEKTNLGFGSMFAKAKGEWECATCLVRNKSDASKCISCETPKPGAVAVSQAITGNFKFGVNTNDSSTSSPFKFGVSDSQSVTKSSSGFSFGVSAKSNEESNSRGSSGFKFGVSEEVKSSALTVGSSESESVKSKEKSEGVSGSFSFGVPPTDKTKEGPKDYKILNFSFTPNTVTESKSENTNAIKSGFTFKLGSQDSPLKFGVGAKNDDKNALPEVKPASELKSGSVADVLKSRDSKSLFQFGKTDKSEESAAPIFNNALSSSHNETSKVTTSFGSPKVSDSSSSTSLSAPTNSFSFGNGTAKTTSASLFSFSTPVSKEEKAPVPSFTFASKREASDNEEPAKKNTFGSSSGSTISNNVNPASLFTFGSKENSITTGSGFGPPPTSTPAFGAPAPASNATQNFQFGTPVPAATAPTPAFSSGTSAPAFGGTASAFGSNANSAPSFAFGQAANRKSAGFDFGQAATNTTSHGFNFGSAATSPVFQFGQKQNDAPGGVPVFQFGAGSTVDASTPAFGGGENPFTPAPPSGRVVKKARRRKQ